MRCPQHCVPGPIRSFKAPQFLWIMDNEQWCWFFTEEGPQILQGRETTEWGGGEVTENTNTNTKTKIQKYKNTNSKRYGDDRWGGGSNHWQLRPIHRGGIPTLLPSIPTLLPQQFFILNFNHVYDALHRHVETSLSVVLIRTQYQLCNILAPYLFRLILLNLVSEMPFERIICLVGAHLKDDGGIWSIPRWKNGIPENRKRG